MSKYDNYGQDHFFTCAHALCLHDISATLVRRDRLPFSPSFPLRPLCLAPCARALSAWMGWWSTDRAEHRACLFCYSYSGKINRPDEQHETSELLKAQIQKCWDAILAGEMSLGICTKLMLTLNCGLEAHCCRSAASASRLSRWVFLVLLYFSLCTGSVNLLVIRESHLRSSQVLPKATS